MPIERRPSMDMAYNKEQFQGRYYRGNWDVPQVHKMLDWAVERAVHNGHTFLRLVVDDSKTYALNCLYCESWACISSYADDFGIWGGVVYRECNGGQDE
jgi:hypothetical protein